MEIAVEPDEVRGAPPIMPAHVELPDVSAEDAFAMRLLARDGDLWVRVAGEASPHRVTGFWTDPHNAARVTLFFA